MTLLNLFTPLIPIEASSLDWSAVGVIGGAVYATYQTITSNQIKSAILGLKLSIQDRFAEIEQKVAVEAQKHMTLEGSVKELKEQIIMLNRDIAYRDGQHQAHSGGAGAD
jgi:hypothetical protein